MLSLLDPKHPLSPDILSYFKQAAPSTEESEQAEVLPQVPVAGLRRKVLGSNKRSAKSSTRSKGSSMKLQTKSKPPQQQQPTIITAFAKYQQVIEHKEGSADEIFPDDILDDVWDFDLSQPNSVVNEETKSDNGRSPSGGEDITEPSQPMLKDKDSRTTTSVSPKVRGSKRQKSSAVCCSSPTAANNKKAKLSQASSATKPQNDITEQTLQDFNDPFDELAACQARKVKGEGTCTYSSAHFIKHQWVRIDDEDEDVDLEDTLKPTSTATTISKRQWVRIDDEDEDTIDLEDTLKPTSTDTTISKLRIDDGDEDAVDLEDTLKPTSIATTITNTYLSDEEEEFDTAPDSFTASSSKQQHKCGCVEVTFTSSLKLPSTTSSSTIPTASQEELNFSTKEIEDILFGISTPDVDLSPAEFPEIEKDRASCSLQLEEYSIPRSTRRSASQPIASCLSEDQEDTRSISRTRAKSYSDSMLETAFKAKFDDITNTVSSPQKDVAISPQKKSEDVSARRSIVDLTQTPSTF